LPALVLLARVGLVTNAFAIFRILSDDELLVTRPTMAAMATTMAAKKAK
jgi:hypothetical protein